MEIFFSGMASSVIVVVGMNIGLDEPVRFLTTIAAFCVLSFIALDK